MIKFENATLIESTFHQIGNPILGGELLLSNVKIELSEYKEKQLLNYFITPFHAIKEVNKFEHSVDLKLNAIFGICDQIFEGGNIVDLSAQIAKHLFSQTRHSAIKSGELFVGFLSEIVYEKTYCKGVVIIKSERKSSYIKILPSTSNSIDIVNGIQMDKIDKACLILNIDYHDGFKVFTYEHNSSDTEYWRRDFLSIEVINESMKQTASLIGLCREYSEEYLLKEYGKKEQLEFLSKSIDYISKSKEIAIKTFDEKIIDRDLDRDFFKKKLFQFIEVNDIQQETTIKIKNEVVRIEKRKIKNEIKLDTFISIKIDPSNSFENYIEQGFDKKRNMKFYKVYYNEEF